MSIWPRVPIGDFCEVVSGATPKTGIPDYWDGNIAWATPKDLSLLNSKHIHDTPRKISEKGLRSCAASVLPAESVLLSSRAPIGYVAVNTRPMATNQGFKSLVPDANKADSGYLYHWLKANRLYLESLGNGATFKEISKATVVKIEIPLPPVPIQRRIAEVLDQVDALRGKRREAIVLLDDLAQSIFLDMFGEQTRAVTVREDLKHPAGWSWKLLTEVAELATGHTPDRSRPEYWGGTIPWINLKEIRDLDGKVTTGTQATLTPAGIANSSAVMLPPGTVCFSRTASIGFVTIAGVPLSTSQDFVNWICGDKLNPKYLMHALTVSRQHLRAISDGSTHKTIYLRLAEKFRTLLPPIELQKEFENRIVEVERLKAAHLAQMELLDELHASVQQRAFRGDLWDNPNI